MVASEAHNLVSKDPGGSSPPPATKMLTYRWMLISSMPVEESLKRWFESNRQYGSACSRVQFESRVYQALKRGVQGIKSFIQFKARKTGVVVEMV